MAVPITVVDAFTTSAFAGNPAAVCVVDGEWDADWMQRLAREMRHSETAFVRPGDGAGWDLRWFTPEIEDDLCGHATLAAAHVLWEENRASDSEPLRFSTRSGELVAVRDGDGIDLDFPARPAEPAPPPPDIVEALGVDPVAAGTNGELWLVEVADPQVVASLQADVRRIASFPIDAVIVTAPGGSGPYDVVSRYFAPAMGIDEDPVTGSAHCTIGPWWAERLGPRLRCHQVSARGGEVRVRVEKDRVWLGGAAVTVLRGDVLV